MSHRPRNVLEVRVAIHEATGIPHSFAKMILCHYQMLGVEEPIVVLPKRESFSVQAPLDPTTREYEHTERCVFDHRRVFHLPLNRQTLNSLVDYALSVEVRRLHMFVASLKILTFAQPFKSFAVFKTYGDYDDKCQGVLVGCQLK